jgi:hypothetical protein
VNPERGGQLQNRLPLDVPLGQFIDLRRQQPGNTSMWLPRYLIRSLSLRIDRQWQLRRSIDRFREKSLQVHLIGSSKTRRYTAGRS